MDGGTEARRDGGTEARTVGGTEDEGQEGPARGTEVEKTSNPPS